VLGGALRRWARDRRVRRHAFHYEHVLGTSFELQVAPGRRRRAQRPAPRPRRRAGVGAADRRRRGVPVLLSVTGLGLLWSLKKVRLSGLVTLVAGCALLLVLAKLAT
jgi:hypothetical protein